MQNLQGLWLNRIQMSVCIFIDLLSRISYFFVCGLLWFNFATVHFSIVAQVKYSSPHIMQMQRISASSTHLLKTQTVSSFEAIILLQVIHLILGRAHATHCMNLKLYHRNLQNDFLLTEIIVAVVKAQYIIVYSKGWVPFKDAWQEGRNSRTLFLLLQFSNVVHVYVEVTKVGGGLCLFANF